MEKFIRRLLSDPDMLRMGHYQRLDDLNLGLGWIYYSLGRVIRPARAVAIGSYRGFVPAVLAKSLLDNSEGGEVLFIDPSYADGFWTSLCQNAKNFPYRQKIHHLDRKSGGHQIQSHYKVLLKTTISNEFSHQKFHLRVLTQARTEPERVTNHFRQLGTPNVRHYRHTTQEFLTTGDYEELTDIGILMIDGYHSAEQARLDYLAFLGKLAAQHIVLFHDSVAQRTSTFYGEDNQYQHTVCLFMDRLRRTPGLEVFTLPFGGGVTLVRGQPESLEYINAPFDNKPLTPAAVSTQIFH